MEITKELLMYAFGVAVLIAITVLRAVNAVSQDLFEKVLLMIIAALISGSVMYHAGRQEVRKHA